MAKSHPAKFQQDSAPQFPVWASSMVAALTLAISLISLNTILTSTYGSSALAMLRSGLAVLMPGSSAATPAEQPAAVAEESGEQPKYRAIGQFLSRRYRVSSEMTTSVVANAHKIGADLKLDPLLILAVIAVESRFNPLAESVMGAKGLMQVIPRLHPDKFQPLGGEKAAFDTHANISVGAKILKDYLRQTGDIAVALQLYVGASTEQNENGYTDKVMAERDRLTQVLRDFEAKRRTARAQPAKPVAAI